MSVSPVTKAAHPVCCDPALRRDTPEIPKPVGGRTPGHALADDATILLEGQWASHEDPEVRQAWAEAMEELSGGTGMILVLLS